MSEADPLVRVRLDISYDGGDFAGWASQPAQRTVQETLETALRTVLRVPAALTVAGRTDSGVHAIGQVAHLDVPREVWEGAGASLVRRLAGVLPPDVRVSAAREVPAEFDARFAALWRRYVYCVSDRESGVDPLVRGFVLGWPRHLDADAMNDAGQRLVGLHDFVAFCRWRDGATTIRTVHELSVRREDDLVTCTIRADAFCHSMVRSVVGALVTVGEGRRPVDWPASLLARTSRSDEVPVLPPHGLTLVEVAYPRDDELAARTRVTRSMRATPPG
jgi:tRNA pseudouridine38-40 synthase